MEALTTDMILVLVVLAGTVTLFVTEIIRIDLAAIGIMVVLGLLGLVEPQELFTGFSSTAVIAIIAIMILGSGLDRSGLMGLLASLLTRAAGKGVRRIRATLAGTAGLVSSFMQNMGTAALFLPVAERISEQTRTPPSRLLMPMGFVAMVGGTLTLVGSSPLILLNDLLEKTAENLDIQIEPFGLFAPAPVGISLVIASILMFTFFGRQLLPDETDEYEPHASIPDIAHHYGLDRDIEPYAVPARSPLNGRRIGSIEAEDNGILLVAMRGHGDLIIAPPRDYIVEPGAIIGLVGSPEDVDRFASHQQLSTVDGDPFSILHDPEHAGLADVLVRPGSNAVGKTVREIQMRASYGVNLLAVYRDDELITDRLRQVELAPGDVLVVFAPWKKLDRLADETSLVIMSDYPTEPARPGKKWWALLAFVLAIGLVLFSDFSLPLSLMTGAIIIMLTGVLTPDEAYRAVSWKTVFLLGGLIPLGRAVEQTGTAAWIAEGVIAATGGLPVWGIQLVIAVLTTAFTLTISNVGAAVLLVPLAANIALGVGADPAQFGLIVALAASNSFLLPTHQVNALLMTPGGYQVKDYLRAGGAMTLLFLVVLITAVNVWM